ncbi:procathepsin L-like [Prionailurus iriomotensis]
MHPSFFLATLCLGIASAAPQVNQSLDEQWSQWKATHGKLYSMDEEGQRRAVWERNMQMIEQHNREHSQGKHSFTMAMNGFGDMTSEEFKQVLNDLKIQKHKKGKVFQAPLFAEIPSSVDWREKGYVTPVKNQYATGALEGQMFRKTGKLVSLSEQNLVDCSWSQGNKGCHGGLMDKAFQYVKDNGGLDSEESYPYHARCIYYDPKCSNKHLNHAVLVVGYGFEGEESDNKKYWIVKNSFVKVLGIDFSAGLELNHEQGWPLLIHPESVLASGALLSISWGANWGKHGYILMAKDRDNHCGIATMASFPIV